MSTAILQQNGDNCQSTERTRGATLARPCHHVPARPTSRRQSPLAEARDVRR